MTGSKLEPQPDDDSGDANLYEEAPGLQGEEPGLHKVPGAQQARPVCPSPRGVHG